MGQLDRLSSGGEPRIEALSGQSAEVPGWPCEPEAPDARIAGQSFFIMPKDEKVPRGKAAPKVAKAAGGKPHDQLRGTALPRREDGPLGSDERRAAAEQALAALREKHLPDELTSGMVDADSRQGRQGRAGGQTLDAIVFIHPTRSVAKSSIPLTTSNAISYTANGTTR